MQEQQKQERNRSKVKSRRATSPRAIEQEINISPIDTTQATFLTRSKVKSPSGTSPRGIVKEITISRIDTTQAKRAPTTPPVVIETHEEVKVNHGSGASSGEQKELDKLKFDLTQTLREKNLENYKTDQIVQVKNVVEDFCKS